MEIPSSFCDLVHVNPEYKVVVCIANRCRKAVVPASLRDHLRRIHKTPLETRQEVARFIAGLNFNYDHSTVKLPPDGSAPQPVIAVGDGFQCRRCSFKSSSKKVMRVHGNEDHHIKRVNNEELFRSVRLQTWFRDSRERYWVVDENQRVDSIPETNSDDDEPTRDTIERSDSQLLLERLKREYRQYDADEEQRRLQLPRKVPLTENDSWLHFTKWNGVLSALKHDIRKTYHFTRKPEETEIELERVL